MSMGKTSMVRGSHMYTNTNRGFKGETLKKIETGRKARDSDRISSALGLNSLQALTEWLERKPSFLLLLIVLQKHFFFYFKENVFPFLWCLSYTWKRKIFFPGCSAWQSGLGSQKPGVCREGSVVTFVCLLMIMLHNRAQAMFPKNWICKKKKKKKSKFLVENFGDLFLLLK